MPYLPAPGRQSPAPPRGWGRRGRRGRSRSGRRNPGGPCGARAALLEVASLQPACCGQRRQGRRLLEIRSGVAWSTLKEPSPRLLRLHLRPLRLGLLRQRSELWRAQQHQRRRRRLPHGQLRSLRPVGRAILEAAPLRSRGPHSCNRCLGRLCRLLVLLDLLVVLARGQKIQALRSKLINDRAARGVL